MATSTARENGLTEITINSFRKFYRMQRHVQFTTECSNKNAIPAFCKLGYRFIDHGKLTIHEINKIEKRSLETALNENKQKLLIYENDFNINLDKLSFTCISPTHFHNLVKYIKNSVFNTEKALDKKRDLKLFKLINKPPSPQNSAIIHNNTGVVIPNDVLSLLHMGSNHSIGGSTRNHGSKVYTELNNIFEIFRKNGRKLGLSELNIEYIRSHISLAGQDITSCFTNDLRITSFLKFQKDNPNTVVLLTDKTQDYVILTKEQYHTKLSNFLDSPKYQKIDNFDLNFQMQAYRNLLHCTMDGCVNQQNGFLLQPSSSISHMYGKVKVHKSEWPIRGICTGYSHMVIGPETYLKKLLNPFTTRCT